MKILRNSELYRKLRGLPTQDEDKLWSALFKGGGGELVDEKIPFLSGGLDHIEIGPNSYTFHDRGVQGKKDNTFRIVA